MCEFCEKIKFGKYGIEFDMEIVKGMYKNHRKGKPCYVVCNENEFIYGIYVSKKEALKGIKESCGNFHLVDLRKCEV